MATTKPVSFKDKEKDLLDYIEGKDFSYYVKELIKKDMNNSCSYKEPNERELSIPKVKKKRIIDYDL